MHSPFRGGRERFLQRVLVKSSSTCGGPFPGERWLLGLTFSIGKAGLQRCVQPGSQLFSVKALLQLLRLCGGLHQRRKARRKSHWQSGDGTGGQADWHHSHGRHRGESSSDGHLWPSIGRQRFRGERGLAVGRGRRQQRLVSGRVQLGTGVRQAVLSLRGWRR